MHPRYNGFLATEKQRNHHDFDITNDDHATMDVHHIGPLHHRQIRGVHRWLLQRRCLGRRLERLLPQRLVGRIRLQICRAEVHVQFSGGDGRSHHLLQAPRAQRRSGQWLLGRSHPPPVGSVPPQTSPSLRQAQDKVDHELQRVQRGTRRRGNREVVHRARGRHARSRDRRGDFRAGGDEPRHPHHGRYVRRRPPHRAVRTGGHDGAAGRLPVRPGRGDHEAHDQVELPDQERRRGAVRHGLRLLRREEWEAGTSVHRPSQGSSDPAAHGGIN
mmetsp:Transcript_202/g.468  ORF Transcript_202/g.468 Transcript_202/m.468 type:complete len:273 (-) Transcript_202:659-1477(-)